MLYLIQTWTRSESYFHAQDIRSLKLTHSSKFHCQLVLSLNECQYNSLDHKFPSWTAQFNQFPCQWDQGCKFIFLNKDTCIYIFWLGENQKSEKKVSVSTHSWYVFPLPIFHGLWPWQLQHQVPGEEDYISLLSTIEVQKKEDWNRGD